MRPPRLPFALMLALSACQKRDPPPPPAPSDLPSPSAPDPSTTPASVRAPVPASASASASAPASAVGAGLPSPLPGRTDGCAEGMVRVEGDYCPAVMQDCVEWHPEYVNRGNRTVSERCLRYQKPSRCVSKKRQKLSFCMDRFEYPNRVGELPRVLTSWRQAVSLCEAEGKRLCTEDEFNFACEGPEILPYVYGYDRDPKTCHIDEEYRFPDHSHQMLHYDACLKDERCAAEMKRLDQRERIGQRTTCVSWAGVFDLNGNVNEWVNLPGKKPPDRSGLKGGWWGPVRNRCRPTVTFHKEEDYGYEQGFRCCADPK